jgi:hypothetical protein
MEEDMVTDRRRPGIFSGRPRDRFTVTVTYKGARGTTHTEDYGCTNSARANEWFNQILNDLGVLQIVITGPDGSLVAEHKKGDV